MSNRNQAGLRSRARRRRHSGQVTWFAGGSAHPDFTPGSVEHSAMRQNGVTAWNTGLRASEYVTVALRSATNSRGTCVIEVAIVGLVSGNRRFGEALSCRGSGAMRRTRSVGARSRITSPPACGLDLNLNRWVACVIGNSVQGRTPGDLTAMELAAPSPHSVRPSRAVFDTQALAQTHTMCLPS
jgi:hypothetical protein